MLDLTGSLLQAKTAMPFRWSGSLKLADLNPIPYKYRPSARRRRGQQGSRPAPLKSFEGVTALKTSFNIWDSVRILQRRRWQLLDVQYVVLFGYICFSLFIAPSAPLAKTAVFVVLPILLLMPVTQQFFLPSLPIWTYLLYFFCSRFIPTAYRPHIWVQVLPALENVLYGANLSNILSAHTHAVFDLLAWIPYGILHFSMPAICSGVLFLFAAPGTAPVFARTLGWMCLLGVTIQLLLPCTPPWYERQFGLAPAHYGMSGSPAGLARVDALLGFDMYTTSFTTAPLPFGAFPSLHSANATLASLFLGYVFPRLRPLFVFYVGWVWWATMYLNHHYAVDLVAGSLLAAAMWYIARSRWLPRRQLDKRSRWAYEYVEFGERPRTHDEEEAYAMGGYAAAAFGLGLLEQRGVADSDEWTVGSSSSFSSRNGSGSRSSTSGSLSPASPDEFGFSHYEHSAGPAGASDGFA